MFGLSSTTHATAWVASSKFWTSTAAPMLTDTYANHHLFEIAFLIDIFRSDTITDSNAILRVKKQGVKKLK